MPIDPYDVCRCGSGKKVKFCCADVSAELDKIDRMIEGEQFAAALEHADRLVPKHPTAAALFETKARIELLLGKVNEATQTLAKFRELQPGSHIMLSELAVLHAMKREGKLAVDTLQLAFDAAGDHPTERLYEAISSVAEAMLSEGNVLAARSHLMMMVGMSGGQDPHPAQMLSRMNQLQGFSLLLKEDMPLQPAPADAPWKTEYDTILQKAYQGNWATGVQKLEALAARVGRQPVIVQSLASLNGRLGRVPEAVALLHEFASLPGVDRDEAIEAEALGQLLDIEAKADQFDLVQITFPITNTDGLMERLLSDRRITSLHVDPATLGDENSPPPKGVFGLLDRPQLAAGTEYGIDDIPNMIGELLVFGRETDREARLEALIVRNADFDTRISKLKELAGDLIGPPSAEVRRGHVSMVQDALTWSWRLPENVTPEKRAQLVDEKRQKVLTEQWPLIKLAALNGKSAAEAAADPASQVRVLASILLLELSGQQSNWRFDFNALRRQLQLPESGPIDPTSLDINRLSLARAHRLMAEKLTDDQLLDLYPRTSVLEANEALRKLAQEIIRRPQLDGQVDRAEAYGMLARIASNTDEALKYIEQGKQLAVSRGGSPGRWLLNELSLRLDRLETAESQKLVREISSKYMQEEGIAQALYQLLMMHGVIGQDGRPVGPRGGGPGAGAFGGPVPAAAPAASSGLWTPDSPTAAPSPEGGKSKLWIPGMD